jgi:Flp pilus assembly protein TadG
MGAAAVEMALVFPLLFAVTYATIVYGYVFFIQQALNRIAEEAVRSAVRVDPTSAGAYSSNLDAAADASITSSKTVTPIIGKAAIVPTRGLSTSTAGGVPISLYTVKLVLPLAALTSSGFASIPLPGNLGTFPPLPMNLTATAVAQVN